MQLYRARQSEPTSVHKAHIHCVLLGCWAYGKRSSTFVGQKKNQLYLEQKFNLTHIMRVTSQAFEDLGGVRALPAITVIQNLVCHRLDLYIVLHCEAEGVNWCNCVISTYWVCQVQVAVALVSASSQCWSGSSHAWAVSRLGSNRQSCRLHSKTWNTWQLITATIQVFDFQCAN